MYAHTGVVYSDARPFRRLCMPGENEKEGMVLRTVYLPERMDTELRELAHRHHRSKNELVRAALANRLLEWKRQNTEAKIDEDAQLALRFG
jgi:plasmid stability protein